MLEPHGAWAPCYKPGMRSLALALLIPALLAGCGSKSTQAVSPDHPALVEREPAPAAPAAAPTPPAPEPAAAGALPTDAEIAAAAGKAVGFIDELAVAIEVNASDCQAMAGAIDGVITRHGRFLEDARRWKGNVEIEAKLEAHMQESGVMERAMQKMMPGMTACAADPAVAAALAAVDG